MLTLLFLALLPDPRPSVAIKHTSLLSAVSRYFLIVVSCTVPSHALSPSRLPELADCAIAVVLGKIIVTARAVHHVPASSTKGRAFYSSRTKGRSKAPKVNIFEASSTAIVSWCDISKHLKLCNRIIVRSSWFDFRLTLKPF